LNDGGERFKFKNPEYGSLEYEEMMKLIRNFCLGSEENRLIIGTDSKDHGSFVLFTTVIVVHKVGKGGMYFYTTRKENIYYDMKSRIFKEAQLSIEMANFLMGSMEEEDMEMISGIEIHIDVGENGPTKELIRSVVGYVNGSGYEVRIKPDSFAASKVADKHTG